MTGIGVPSTRLALMLGCEQPIMAFSPTPAVVAAVSEAGGFGVLGAQRMSEQEFDEALNWLDERLGATPYGVDLLLYSGPVSGQVDTSLDHLEADIPAGHRRYVEGLRERFSLQVDDVPHDSESRRHAERTIARIPTRERLDDLVEIVANHRPRLVVSALGPFPAEIGDRFRSHGMLLGGVVGAREHVAHHLDAGVDMLVAQGSEAAGHTGAIGTMVLVPQVIEAAGGIPVAAAGGIARGDQILASLALGADAVWIGSLWLTTTESDIHPIVKDKLVAARSSDAVQTSWWTGKPVRMLRTALTEAWEEPGTPPPLAPFMQRLLVKDVWIDAFATEDRELMGEVVGQAVGMMNDETSVAQVMERLTRECAAAYNTLTGVAYAGGHD